MEPPTNVTVAAASRDGRVRLWDAATSRQWATLYMDERGACAAEFTRDGRLVALETQEETIKLWEVTNPSPVSFNIPATGHFTFSPDGNLAAIWDVDEPRVVLWDTTTAGQRGGFHCGGQGVSSVNFSPNSEYLAIGSCEGSIRLWETTSQRLILDRHLGNHSNPELGFSPDGAIFAVASADVVTLWNVATEATLATLDGCAVQFASDGSRAAAGSRDGRIVVWTRRTGRLLVLDAGLDPHARFQLSADGRVVAAIHGGTTTLWDASTGQARATLDGNVVEFSPDSTLVATCIAPPESPPTRTDVTLWDTETGAQRVVLDAGIRMTRKFRFSPDGRFLVSWLADETVVLWGVSNGVQRVALRGDELCFSAYGHVAVGAGDGTVAVWDETRGEVVLARSGGAIEAVAFSSK